MVVFNSSTKREGLSLNGDILRGPDMNNMFLGILMHSHKEPAAVMADVLLLHFLWRPLWLPEVFVALEQRHSQVDHWILQESACFWELSLLWWWSMAWEKTHGEEEYGAEIKRFIMRNSYVDDGLASFPTNNESISILKRTKSMWAESSIKLHKIASKSRAVMDTFPPEEWARNPSRSGANHWPLATAVQFWTHLELAVWHFHLLRREKKPFARRGILSTVIGLYDPLGVCGTCCVQEKALVREPSAEQFEWDTPLPAVKEQQWRLQTDSLCELEQLQIFTLCAHFYVPRNREISPMPSRWHFQQ